MAEYQFSGGELLYLAAKAGASEFYGVEDVFSHLPESELRVRLLEIEKSLEEKKYLQEDFDGNTVITGTIQKMVEVCAQYDGFFFMEYSKEGEEGYRYFFIKENEIYRMKKAGKDEYQIKAVNADEVRSETGEILSLSSFEKKSDEHFMIHQREMEHISALAKHGAPEEALAQLKRAGCPEVIGKTVTAALQGKADFYSMVFLNPKEDSPYGMMLIKGRILLTVKYEMKNYEDYVAFFAADAAEEKRKMELGYQKLGIREQAQFA